MHITRLASAAAVAATFAMATTPVAAAEMPSPALAGPAAARAFDSDAVNAHQYCHYRRHRGTDAGDVIGTVVVLGAIAAIASAATNAGRSRDGDYRYPQRAPYPDQRYDYRSSMPDQRYDGSRGIDRAVAVCASAIERDRRVDTIDNAVRNAAGWSVTGRLRSGESFSCAIGNDGWIDRIDYGRRDDYRGSDAGLGVQDRQWDDQQYASARGEQQEVLSLPDTPGVNDGGPVDDGRYETAGPPITGG